MSLYVGQGKQILNKHYGQDLSSQYMNRLYSQVFKHGVLYDGDDHDSFTTEIVNGDLVITVGELSLLVASRNLPEIILKVDTTTSFSKTRKSNYGYYFIARYEWYDENSAVEFLFINEPESTDIVLLEINDDNETSFDNQTRPNLTLVNPYASYTDADYLDCKTPGNESGQIPLNNDILNVDLNAEQISGIDWAEFSLNDNTLQTGLATEKFQEYIIQPQDGVTSPDEYNQIPISNGILQIDLNCQFLNGKELDYFISNEHTHYFGKIIDTEDFYKVDCVSENNKMTACSIKEDDISVDKVVPFAYGFKEEATYTPIFESGKIALTSNEKVEIYFAREIKNPRIFCQKVTDVLNPGNHTQMRLYSERSVFIYEVTDISFKIRQFPEFMIDEGDPVGGNYPIKRNDPVNVNEDNFTYFYYWLAVGEKP